MSRVFLLHLLSVISLSFLISTIPAAKAECEDQARALIEDDIRLLMRQLTSTEAQLILTRYSAQLATLASLGNTSESGMRTLIQLVSEYWLRLKTQRLTQDEILQRVDQAVQRMLGAAPCP